ncbi:hypothetical protein [Pseudochrobactrum saccharolyticum]|uniref:hypothetical protein n=1 Tax=Pseudochrobactrum saccharolyticum TaxID=354352 RepID=UPI00276B6A1C|nr:hypothetical protein [Pseudochrobactrum saccharolyticum]MDP8249590.1 hypothetical protein [Pseudochrobactrum saccharolyticum]
MASEFKPNKIIDANGALFNKTSENEDGTTTYTRTVPDVTELKRYRLHWSDFDTAYMEIDSIEGEYVLYSQAAEIIAAIREEWSKAHNADQKAFLAAIKRAEAAEAKLAQYEAQEPIGYLIGDGHFTMSEKQAEIAKSCTTFTVIPLYASPTPAADLKAENERLREALTKISSPTQTAGLLWWQVEARAALNVEASNDKG